MKIWTEQEKENYRRALSKIKESRQRPKEKETPFLLRGSIHDKDISGVKDLMKWVDKTYGKKETN